MDTEWHPSKKMNQSFNAPYHYNMLEEPRDATEHQTILSFTFTVKIYEPIIKKLYEHFAREFFLLPL